MAYLRSNQTGLAAERTRLTKAKADRAELDLRLRAGQLYEKAAMDHPMVKRGRTVRDAILSVPDRIAGIVSAESDQGKVHAIIYKELHQALVALTS